MNALMQALADFLSLRKNGTVMQQIGSLIALLAIIFTVVGSAFTSIQVLRNAASNAPAVTAPAIPVQNAPPVELPAPTTTILPEAVPIVRVGIEDAGRAQSVEILTNDVSIEPVMRQ